MFDQVFFLFTFFLITSSTDRSGRFYTFQDVQNIKGPAGTKLIVI